MLGLIAAIVVTIPGTVAASAAFRASRRNRDRISDVQSTVDTVSEQVTNGHKSNLRDDLTKSVDNTHGLRDQMTESVRLMGIIRTAMERLQDEDIRLIRGDVSRVSEDIQVLRHELSDERDARTDLDERVREHHRQYHPPPPEPG